MIKNRKIELKLSKLKWYTNNNILLLFVENIVSYSKNLFIRNTCVISTHTYDFAVTQNLCNLQKFRFFLIHIKSFFIRIFIIGCIEYSFLIILCIKLKL